MNKINVEILKLHEDVSLPKYGTEYSSGFDLASYLKINREEYIDLIETKFNKNSSDYSLHTDEKGLVVTIFPGKTVPIPTGLKIGLSDGFELQLRPRSGLSILGLTLANTPGTIDCDYRGEIIILAHNQSQVPLSVNSGMRIAQGVICPVFQANWTEVNELSKTVRNESGFNSTGTH